MSVLARKEVGVSEHALPGGERLDALQALRAVAAGMVVFCHALGAWGDRQGVVAPDKSLEVLGGLGVKIFFVISGFIIATSVGRRPIARGAGATSLFFRRRVIRVVPLYWLASLAAVLKLSAQGSVPPIGDIARSLLFIPFDRDPVLTQGWSLDYEMFFYVIFAAALLLSLRSRYVGVALTLGALMLLRVTGALTPHHFDALYRWADSLLLFFLAGVALALLRDPVRKRLPVTLSLPTVAASVVALVVAYAVLVHEGLHHPEALYVDLPIAVAAVALCVLPHIPPATHLRLRTLLVRAGDGSYSTYLLHTFLLGAVGHVLVTAHLGGHDLPFALAQVVACTIAGIALYHAFERPLTRRLNATFARSPRAARPADAPVAVAA
jgi:exopolysaccharide production protein ExoZ